MDALLDTGTDELLASFDEGVLRLVLNRPHARNSLSDTLSPALRRCFARIPEFPEVRKFLLFWEINLDGALHSVRVAQVPLITEGDASFADFVWTLH